MVLLTEVDHLTKDAQHALRRTMEKYMATCRLILCCNSTSKVIPAIRSRCLGVRVAAPSSDEVRKIRTHIHTVYLRNSSGTIIPDKFSDKLEIYVSELAFLSPVNVPHRKNFTAMTFYFLQVCQILQQTCKKEGLNLPLDLAKKIASKSNRNLRRAILMCEACKVQQ